MYIYIVKLITLIGTVMSMLVYNFHKPFKGIKTARNKKYKARASLKNYLDIHYEKKKSETLKPCIIYFHGGGWCCYSKGIYTTLSRRLAKMGYVVFNCNYSLAPLKKMDAIMSDALAALKYARSVAEKYGGDKDKIILGGDSAGAHIASLLAGQINSGKIDYCEALGKIKALLLFYGVFDLDTMQKTGFPNIRTYAKASLVYKGKNVAENREFSSVDYVDSSFPPCLVASGEIDKLHLSQSAEFAKVLEKNNVKVEKLFFKKSEKRAMHAYMIFDGLETNVVTLKRAEKFLKGVLS